jgi:hypothetical protein
MRKLLPFLILLALAFPVSGTTVTLYDASLNTNPAVQGWGFGSLPIFGPFPTGGLSGGAFELSTTNGSVIQAGFFRTVTMPFTLDLAYGFRLRMDVKILSESHSSPNRAGFSIIALSDSLSGIELGFWEDEIWAQSGSDFKHAEGKSFNTKSAFRRYELTVKGSGYSLSADGLPVLTGAVRDYSAFGFPYNSKNFLFFGDNTTSASGAAAIRFASITQIPEPAMLLPVALALAATVVARRRV